MKIPPRIDEALVASADVDKGVWDSAWDRATALVASGLGYAPAVESEITHGAEFVIDLLVPEETKTGDNRIFKADSITARDFPITLYWQPSTASGHDGSVIVGRIDSAERLIADEENGLPYSGWGNARGVFDFGPYGVEAERLVRHGFLRGVSVDLDSFEASAQKTEFSDDDSDSEIIKSEEITVEKSRVTAATLTGKPAFQECTIRIYEPEFEMFEIEDGEYVEESGDLEDTFASITASAIPVVPPRAWFQNPNLKAPTPITVEDDGRVFGHIASWESAHIGMAGKVRPPRSRSDYKYFRHGVIRTDDGTDVTVGQLTLAGGHASLSASANEAIKHYDDTASALVDVNIGEDQFGIWVAGALRPDATPSQIRALRASAPSGDWRPINGRHELVAACCVNVPGFPVARAMVAGGQITALVAAGAHSLALLRNPVEDLQERVDALERQQFATRKAELVSKMRPALDTRQTSLASSAHAAIDAFNRAKSQRDAELALTAAEMKKRLGF